MKTSPQALFPVVLMALMAGLTFWLARLMQIETPAPDGRNRHDPDYAIEKFTVRRFDAQGNLQHILEARSMIHYPDNDATDLADPRVVVLGGAAALHVSAARGTIGKNGSVVVLHDDVDVLREAAPNLPPARFHTSVATLYPDDEYLTTAAPVTLTEGASVVRGTGFELNNRTQQAVLHNQVRATYLKEKP